jgi:hypothetical protein
MSSNPFIFQYLIGRQAELQQISQLLAKDGDLMVTGVPGSGRRLLIRQAAQQIGARVLEIDCLRAINSSRFLELLAEGLLEIFTDPVELELIQQWSIQYPLILEHAAAQQARLLWNVSRQEEWVILKALLLLPQVMAERLDCRVVMVFQNFPHIRSWDRDGKWEDYLRQEVQQQSRVNYVVVATVPEPWAIASDLQMISLPPLGREDLQPWIVNAMQKAGLQFDANALDLFLTYVQGHVGDAIALARRICLGYRASNDSGFLASVFDCEAAPMAQVAELPKAPNAESQELPSQTRLIQPHHVHRSTLALVEDLSLTFESLILLLPPIQARVLESLALDPTHSPHSRDYIQKHQLSKGGGLQGALAGLEQKGLIYGSKYDYRIAMPLLAFWLKHRMS